KKLRYLFYLVPAEMLWVNIHSSFILGIFIAGAYACGSCIDDMRQGGFKGNVSSGTLRFAAVTAFIGLATFINPYGYKLAFFPLVHMGGENAEALRYIGEWKPVKFNELFFYLYPRPLDYLAFKVFVFGAVFALILNRRALKTRDLLLTGGALYLAVSHVRWIAMFAYFSAPIIVWNISHWLDERHGRGVYLRRLCVLTLVLLVAALSYDYARLRGRDIYGIGIKAGHFPEGTVAFMKKYGVKGNMFNEYVFGGYLIYNYPESKVFIDGRTPTVYSPYFFWQSRMADRESLWKKLTDDYSVTVALVSSMHGLCGKLGKNPEWSAVSFDDVSVLFLKDVSENKPIISSHAIRETDPCSSDKYAIPSDKEKLKAMRHELKALDWSVISSARPHFLMGAVSTGLGGEYLEEAVKEYSTALSIIDDKRTRYDMGIALLKLKRYRHALDQFEKGLKMDKGFISANYGIGLSYYYLGNYEKSKGFLEKYIEAEGDKSEDLSYRFLGRSCFELKDFECAERYLKRAGFLTTEPKELADIYYRIGSSLIELDRESEGLNLYRTALSLEPEYKKVLASVADEFFKKGDLALAKAVRDIISDKN
ncbi:MAG: hypothetical protein HY880_05880, partial [Deltaproteobacteria bacterium]|nr:hypothetical protein [Deltaproteobacteria bacterium]